MTPVRTLYAFALLALLHAAAARSQTEASTLLVAQIEPQPVPQALEKLSQQCGLQFAYLSDVVHDQRARGAPAGIPAQTALTLLLDGTGLVSEFLNGRTVRIVPGPEPQLMAEIVIVAVRFIPRPPQFPAATGRERRRLEAANSEIERRISRGRLLYGQPELDSYLQGIAARLLAADGTASDSVRVRVIKGTQASGFALSNGSIYLTTALLASLTSEAEVAAVLGHELTHITNAHVLRGLRNEARWSSVSGPASVMFGLMVGLAEKRAAGAQNRTAIQLPEEVLRIWTRAAASGYSPELEREADDTAIRRLIAAGYDASGALAALQHLTEQVPEGPPTALKAPQLIDASHRGQSPTARGGTGTALYASQPHLARRLTSYRELLAGQLAGAVGAGREIRREAYAAQLAGLRLDQVAILLNAGALDRADAALDALVGAADSARAEFLRGEIARSRSPRTSDSTARALAAYQRAVQLPTPPAEAFRETGYLYWQEGNFPAARTALESYLTRAPLAVDAPLVRWYLEQRTGNSPTTAVIAVH